MRSFYNESSVPMGDSPFKAARNVGNVELLSNQAVARRRNEPFRRLKATTMAKLLKQARAARGPPEGEFDDLASLTSEAPSMMSMMSSNTEALLRHQDTEYVILDLRDPDEFARFRIVDAINFPVPYIMRDRVPQEIFRMKNVPQKYIIVYALDERQGVDAAKKFVERGYENLYLLTGGIEEFAREFPQYVQGYGAPAEEAKSSSVSTFASRSMRS